MTGEEFLERRRKLNLTQEQIAKALGVGKQAVKNWEANRRAIRQSTIISLEHLERARKGEAA